MTAAQPTVITRHEPAPGRRKGYDWPRFRRAIRRLIEDSTRTEEVFEIIEALDKESTPAELETFLAEATADELLKERPNLVAALQNRAALAEMPEGSFGRAYLAFMESGALSADGLIEADEGRASAIAQAELDEGTAGDGDVDADRREAAQWLGTRTPLAR